MASTVESAADAYRNREALVATLQALADELEAALGGIREHLWDAQQSAHEAAAALCKAAKSNV